VKSEVGSTKRVWASVIYLVSYSFFSYNNKNIKKYVINILGSIMYKRNYIMTG